MSWRIVFAVGPRSLGGGSVVQGIGPATSHRVRTSECAPMAVVFEEGVKSCERAPLYSRTLVGQPPQTSDLVRQMAAAAFDKPVPVTQISGEHCVRLHFPS